jgi:hypothetical protein
MDDHPLGYFFDALYTSGFYYYFIGIAQVLAAFLLMTQRLATFGAIIYSSIIVNIWLITLSLSFKGTWIITSLMVLACLALLIWDGQKLKSILSYNSLLKIKTYSDPSSYWQVLGFIYYTLLMICSVIAKNTNVTGTIFLFIILLLIGSNMYALRHYKKTRSLI